MSKKKKIALKDIPTDVLLVWNIQYFGQLIGMKQYANCQEIIDKYPEYFVWEHKYKNIPQEVHDAFNRECYPDRYKPIEHKGLYEGLYKELNKPYVISPCTEGDFLSFIKRMDEHIEKRKKEEKAAEKREMEIWDKHYKKYGLEYRK